MSKQWLSLDRFMAIVRKVGTDAHSIAEEAIRQFAEEAADVAAHHAPMRPQGRVVRDKIIALVGEVLDAS